MTKRTPTFTDGQPEGSNWFDGNTVELSGYLQSLKRPGWLDDETWSHVQETLGLFVAEYEASSKGQYRAELAYAVGRIFESELNEEATALSCYQAAFKADPRHGPTTAAGRRMFGRIGRWSVVLKFLEAEVRSADDPIRKARLVREMADVYLLRFRRFEESQALFERSDRSNPNQLFVLLRRVQIAGLRGSMEEVRRLCEGIAHTQGATDGAVAAIALGLGDLLRAGEMEMAVALYSALPRLVKGMPDIGTLAERMGPHHLGAQAYFEAQRRIIWSIPDPSVRADLFRSVAAEAASLGERAATLEFAAQAVQAQPNQAEHWAALARHHERFGSIPEASEALRKCIRLESVGAQRLAQARRLAKIEMPTLEVAAGWRSVLELEPSDQYGHWCQRRALARAGDWKTLKDNLLDGVAEERSVMVRAGLQWLAAFLMRYQLEDASSAHSLFQAAYQAAPNSWLGTVFWSASLQEAGDDAAANSLPLGSIGAVQSDELGRDTAESFASSLLMYFSTDQFDEQYLPHWSLEDPLVRQVAAFLGSPSPNLDVFAAGITERVSASESATVRAGLCRWLGSLYLSEGRAEDAIEPIEQALAIRSDCLSTAGLAVAISREVGPAERLAESLIALANLASDPIRAAECLAEAACLNGSQDEVTRHLLMRSIKQYPDCVRGRRQLAKQAHEMLSADSALELWRILGRAASVPATRASCLLEASEIARVQLESVDDAVTAIDESEESINGSLLPILYLERVACSTGAVQILVDGYKRAARLLSDPVLRVDYALGRARILEFSGEYYDALDAYQEILSADSRNAEALEWLARWVDETGDVDLLEILQDKWASNEWSRSETPGFLAEAARTFLLAGQFEEARRSLRLVLESHPESVVALQYLRVMATREDQEVAVRQALITLAGVATSDDIAVSLYLDAVMKAEANGESALAARCLIDALGRGVRQSEILKRLRGIAEKEGLWQRYADGLLIAMENDAVGEQLEQSALEYILVVRDRLMDAERAFGPVQDVLSRYSQSSVRFLRAAGDLASDLEQWVHAAEWYDRAKLRSTDEELRRALGFRLASVYEKRLLDLNRARTELLYIVDLNPNDVLALERLVDLEMKSGRLSEARVALTRAITASEDPDKRSALRLRQSELYLHDQQLSSDEQLRAARAGLVAASTETPASAAVYEALANVYGDLSDTNAEQEALRMAVHLTDRPADRSRLTERLEHGAEVLSGTGQDRLLRAVAGDDPINPEAVAGLIEQGVGDQFLESLLHGLVSPIEADSDVLSSTLPAEHVDMDRLWSDLDGEQLETLRRLTELLPPVFMMAPPATRSAVANPEGVAETTCLAPLPLFSAFSVRGVLTLSAGLERAPTDVSMFVRHRAEALAARNLAFISRWEGHEIEVIVMAIGECAGLLQSGTDVEGVEDLVRVLEPHLADRSWTEDSFRDVSMGLELRAELGGFVDRVRIAADRVALARQKSPSAAMRAFRLALRGADSGRAMELRRYQMALARWVITGEFQRFCGLSITEG